MKLPALVRQPVARLDRLQRLIIKRLEKRALVKAEKQRLPAPDPATVQVETPCDECRDGRHDQCSRSEQDCDFPDDCTCAQCHAPAAQTP